jgi:hypothetical protein
VGIQWGARPPSKVCKGSIRLLAIAAGQEVRIAVLGDVIGLETHWTGAKTVPCLGGEDCPACEFPRTWKGYCPILADGWSIHGKMPGRHPWVLVISEEIGEESLTWVRGTVATVGRPGRRNNGCMTSSILGQTPLETLIPAWDVRPYVLRACGYGGSAYAKLRLAN